MKKTIRVFLSCVLAVSMFTSQVAWAGYVPSTHAITSQQTKQSRSEIISLLDRSDVRAALETQGVAPEEAKARVAMLPSSQIEKLKTQLDALPAGEGAVGAVVGGFVIVFLVLLFTDIIGATDVFDFDDEIL